MNDNSVSDPENTLPRLVAAADLAEICDCTERTIRNYAKQGIVRRAKTHGMYYFAESVHEWMLYQATGRTPDEREAIDRELADDPLERAIRLYR